MRLRGSEAAAESLSSARVATAAPPLAMLLDATRRKELHGLSDSTGSQPDHMAKGRQVHHWE